MVLSEADAGVHARRELERNGSAGRCLMTRAREDERAGLRAALAEAEEDAFAHGPRGPRYAGPIAPDPENGSSVDVVWDGFRWVAIGVDTVPGRWRRGRKRRKWGRRVEEELVVLDGRPSPEVEAAMKAWYERYASLSSDYAVLTSFPAPPAWACGKLGCKERRTERRLEACEHDISVCVEGRSRKELKRCKVMFHPDRSRACVEEKREEWREMAGEVFVGFVAGIGRRERAVIDEKSL